jgi:hypothetical protein
MDDGRGVAWVTVQAATLVRAGSLLFASGAAADLSYHLLPTSWPVLERLLGPEGTHAHLVTLLGMVAILAGLLLRGLRHVY